MTNINVEGMTMWASYKERIKNNCVGSFEGIPDLTYWRNNLFANILIFVLPFSLLTLIPGLYWTFKIGEYQVAIIDILTISVVFFIAFYPNIRVETRKIMFIACTYLFSCLLLFNVGLYGPVLIYLMSACIFFILIFPPTHAFVPAFLNTGICLGFGILIYLDFVPWPRDVENTTGAWIATTSNLVFLSFLFGALIPKLFNGLEKTIDNQKELYLRLAEEQRLLKESNRLTIISNKKLKTAQELGKIGNWEADLIENKLYWSDEVYRIFGLEQGSEITFETYLSMLHPESQSGYSNLEKRINADNTVYIVEVKVIAANGDVKCICERGKIYFNELKEPISIQGTIQDISMQKAHIAAIEQQNARLKEIGWHHSHIVRAPLARIMGLFSIWKISSFEEIENENLVEHILSSAEELDTVVRDIIKQTENVAVENEIS